MCVYVKLCCQLSQTVAYPVDRGDVGGMKKNNTHTHTHIYTLGRNTLHVKK